LLSNVKDEHVLCKIFEGYSILDLQYLLIQVYCDPEGLYIKDLNFIDCMSYFEKRVLQQGGVDFDKFTSEFYENSKKNNSNFERGNELLPIIVGREAITQ
jgi:hypothetical protein